MGYEKEREAAVQELKRLVKKYADVKEPPRAIGGPFSLTPQEMLREVENETELGRQLVASFAALRRQFPST